MTCEHPRLHPEVFDQTLGVVCPDCGLAECCWDDHVSERLWNLACTNDPEANPCEQSRDDVCFLCEEPIRALCSDSATLDAEQAAVVAAAVADPPKASASLRAKMAAQRSEIPSDGEPPIVCPGCHAVAPERCAPGCIDDEMAKMRERREDEGDPEEGDDDRAED